MRRGRTIFKRDLGVGPHYDSAYVHDVCIEASTEDLYFGILKFGTCSSLAVGYTFPSYAGKHLTFLSK